MIAAAHKMEYVVVDKDTDLPTTNLFKREAFPSTSEKLPVHVSDYIDEVNAGTKPTDIMDLLLSLRRSVNFRNGLSLIMKDLMTEYDSYKLPDYAIGRKITIIFKFPEDLRISDTLTFECTYNDYTTEIGIGIRFDPELNYLTW
jgi:hypothetical protein|tara:strand:+ start:694 stop:1125 length:432 start_codon:yes stop_codon:yes gene_type:complete